MGMSYLSPNLLGLGWSLDAYVLADYEILKQLFRRRPGLEIVEFPWIYHRACEVPNIKAIILLIAVDLVVGVCRAHRNILPPTCVR